jgi:hypothetical protein
MFTAALAALTRFWGGDQNLLFPLQDDLAGHELFWALVDRLDADHFLIYNGAAADVEDLAPEDYAAALERERQRVAPYDEEVIRRHLDESAAFGVEPSAASARYSEPFQLLRRRRCRRSRKKARLRVATTGL